MNLSNLKHGYYHLMSALKVYSIVIFWCIATLSMAQTALEGQVIDAQTKKAISSAEVFAVSTGEIAQVDKQGNFRLTSLRSGNQELIIFSYEYETQRLKVDLSAQNKIAIEMTPLTTELSEVVIQQQRDEIFNLKRLLPVEGTAIYAGKKNEVVLVDQIVGSIATNNSRQIYAQVVGLNIYENADAGLQLNIGGRGLDPNRTANFNTRQNGYDISADVLGYPESYYTPPAEALQEIQVIRGAASLQYGTQFGGLVNFRMKEPVSDRKLAVTSRQSVGSFGLFSSFNSFSGTIGKLSYYSYYQYKGSDGFRPNAAFDAHNVFGYVNYEFTERTNLTAEATYMYYLSQQPGGLTDAQFEQNPRFSNRTRNWFEVNWRLYSLKFEHQFTPLTELNINVFGLDASRNALGFRGNPVNLNGNPITAEDEQDGDGNFIYPRDLISGEFKNWGVESRFLHRYKLGDKDAVFLIGSKYYHANNTSIQGPGSQNTDADFQFRFNRFPDYANQSEFDFPNRNLAVFGEHIFFINDRFTLTPGFRHEYIRTESAGFYQQVNFDNAGNPIANATLTDNRTLERNFTLLGLGINYEFSNQTELYANISENYRSVTFSDIRVVNPTFIIDPNISDEKGYTADFGFRGQWKEMINFDIGGFSLLYDDRIGIVLDDRANRVRKNIGKAIIYGIESFIDWNLLKTFKVENNQFKLGWFVNSAFTNSEYLESEENNVRGKKVEFIPSINLKTGLKFGYRNLLGSVQFTKITEQYTDVENSEVPAAGDNRSGIIGPIPGYQILDLGLSYTYKNWKIETGINNMLDEMYFTRRATGYPGPGIIPSEPRNYYLTLQIKL